MSTKLSKLMFRLSSSPQGSNQKFSFFAFFAWRRVSSSFQVSYLFFISPSLPLSSSELWLLSRTSRNRLALVYLVYCEDRVFFLSKSMADVRTAAVFNHFVLAWRWWRPWPWQRHLTHRHRAASSCWL